MWNNLKNLLTLKYVKVLGGLLSDINNTQKQVQSKV